MLKKKVAIIGAGIAGMSAAHTLQNAGLSVVVFEKSRGWGGRCATKRWEGQILDHGAQYFTMRDPDFRQAAQAACGEELRLITGRMISETGQDLPAEERYYHAAGNSRLVRALGAGVEARTECAIGSIVGLTVCGEDFDAILSTAPLPQTCLLAGISPEIKPYVPCLTALLLYAGGPSGPATELYAISDRSGSPLEWSACENHKAGRISPDKTAMIAQSSADFSREYLEADPAEWGGILQRLVEKRWELSSGSLLKIHTHRWRYARTEAVAMLPALPEGWFFAGDAIRGSRVESAWIAGRDEANRIVEALRYI
ncbi:MAG: NAD(P)/FAD-dependent oxidoreductase [Terrimicrobiaceae bacterium]